MMEQTASYPWFMNYDSSWISLNGNSMSMGGAVVCVSYRNYNTSWSDFNLASQMQVTANFGFRVYTDIKSYNAVAKGFVQNVTLNILDAASHLTTTSIVAAILLTNLTI